MPIYILQAISLSYNRSSACSREDILNIYHNIFEPSGMLFEETWYEMSEFMNKAILKLENLRDGFGVKDETVLPFAPMVPILATLIREIETRENKVECYNKLRIWYWSSVFSNAYSGAVDSQLTADFKEMRDWFSYSERTPKTVDRFRKEFDTLDLRQVQSRGSAMYKGVLSLLALEGSKDFDTNQTLENARSNDRDHIFPKREFGSKKYINSILNMTWMSDDTNRKIKNYEKPSTYVQKFITEKYGGDRNEFLKVLETHFINKDMFDYMLKDNFEEFIEERHKLISARIKELVDIEEPIHKVGLISPENPFSNKMIIWNTIKACHDYIYWVDKYFSTEGLQLLVTSVDRNKIKTIKILTSLAKVDHKFRRLFDDFRREMANNDINCELKVITDNQLNASLHDRWIISKNNCFNIPSPDVIARGQYSEVKSTLNRPPFEKWWDQSLDIITNWNEIENLKNSPLGSR